MTHRISDSLTFPAVGALALAAALAGCAPGHGKYTTQGIEAAQERMAVIKSGTEWDMAQQQFLAGDLSKALKSVDRSIQINAKVAKAHSLRGRILAELGQLEQAVISFKQAIETDAAFVEAHYYLGVLHERFNDSDAALAYYEASAALAPEEAQYTVAAAEVLIDQNRLDAAERLLESRVKQFQHNAGVRQTLGHLALMRGDAALAVTLFDEARLLAPDDHSILEDLAVAQVRAERFIEAEFSLRSLLSRKDNKDRRDLHRLQAKVLIELDRPVDARAILLALASDELGRGDVETWIELGQVALLLGDGSRVRIAASRVAAIDSQRFEGPMLSALWAHSRGDLDTALQQITRAAVLARGVDPTPMIVRASILRGMGRFAEAESSLVEALTIDPAEPRARRMLAEVGIDQ